MKLKHMMIIAISICMVAALSAPVLAEDSGAVDFGGAGATYDLSNKVWIQYLTDDTSNPQEFGVGTVHSAGDREYQTSDGTSIIFWQTVAKGTTAVTNPVAGYTTDQFTAAGWSAL
jgi:hypothetical protein